MNGLDIQELNRKLMMLQQQRSGEREGSGAGLEDGEGEQEEEEQDQRAVETSPRANYQRSDALQATQQQQARALLSNQTNQLQQKNITSGGSGVVEAVEQQHQRASSNNPKSSAQQFLIQQQQKLQGRSYQNMSRKNLQFSQRNLSIRDFEVFTTLGTGTFGRVKLVKLRGDTENTSYALKMMKKTEIVKLKQVDHIKSEKNILSEIQHPFLVSLKSSFQDERYIYMLFEFVSGGELFSRLRKDGRFSNDIALFYISEIFTALQYLHKCNIVYRDLKPENLLIDKEGHIKIADFGFAKKMERSRTFTLCGTPEYLAPEIIQGARAGYGKSVDWWALGVLIFEMLSGHPPFYDNDPMGIYKKILSSIIEFPQFFSLRAKDLIRKLLNPLIERRLGCQDDGDSIRAHKWFRGVNFDEVQAKQVPPPWIPFLKNQDDVQWFERYPESKQEARALPDDLVYLFEDF